MSNDPPDGLSEAEADEHVGYGSGFVFMLVASALLLAISLFYLTR